MGIALVTGASAGIGTEIAKLFAAEGHSVILVARREARLREVSSELQKINADIKTWVIAVDLSRLGAGQELFKKVSALGLEVDYLVNNAGAGSGGLFKDLSLEKELQLMDLNMRSMVETVHCFLPQMLKRGSGRILNVGSGAGFQPGPLMTTYSAAKAFVNSFSEALHEELKDTGVTCTLLVPGYTTTEFQKAAAIKGMSGDFNKATPEKVARDGYRAMMKGRALKVSGFFNWCGMQGLRILPRALIRKIAAQVNRTQVSG